jgi:hypothetical protein
VRVEQQRRDALAKLVVAAGLRKQPRRAIDDELALTPGVARDERASCAIASSAV